MRDLQKMVEDNRARNALMEPAFQPSDTIISNQQEVPDALINAGTEKRNTEVTPLAKAPKPRQLALTAYEKPPLQQTPEKKQRFNRVAPLGEEQIATDINTQRKILKKTF